MATSLFVVQSIGRWGTRFPQVAQGKQGYNTIAEARTVAEGEVKDGAYYAEVYDCTESPRGHLVLTATHIGVRFANNGDALLHNLERATVQPQCGCAGH